MGMLTFVKKHHWWLIAALVVTAMLLFVINRDSRNESVQATATVQEGNIANRVLVFGKAQPAEIFHLSFDVAGKLTTYPYREGDSITQGKLVARLDGRTVLADITQAESNINIERSRLVELSAPISQEDQATQEARIEKQALQVLGARQDLQNAMDDALGDFYDLVELVIDDHYFSGSDPERTVLRFREAERVTEEEREALSEQRVVLELGYRALLADSDTARQYQDFNNLIGFASQLAQELRDLLDGQTSIVAAGIRDELEEFGEDALDLYTALNSLYTVWQTAEEELAVVESQLTSDLAGANDPTLDYQESVIALREAELASLYTDLSRLTLTSPVTGVVFDAPLTNYQTVSAGETVASVVLDEPLVVKAGVAEADVAYVGVGNPVTVTFDALGDQNFTALVGEVNNRENIGETIPSYETQFVFTDGQDLSRVRSGMTANITVQSGLREDVTYIPARFLKQRGGESVVLVQDDEGTIAERVVGVGLRANTGETEIISGLEQGEMVVIVK